MGIYVTRSKDRGGYVWGALLSSVTDPLLQGLWRSSVGCCWVWSVVHPNDINYAKVAFGKIHRYSRSCMATTLEKSGIQRGRTVHDEVLNLSRILYAGEPELVFQ